MMIGGMNNGDIIHVMINNEGYNALLNQLQQYDQEIQDIIKKFLQIDDNTSEINILYNLITDNKLSLIIYGEMLISILKKIDRNENSEQMVVLPYCIYYNIYKDDSVINKTFTDYLNNSLDTMPRVPYESMYDL